MRRLVFAIAMATASRAAAQAGTDIWLAPLKIEMGRVALGTPRNFTNRPGYDNQPSWSAKGDVIYFTSTRDGQTDIYSREVASGKETQITTSNPESEYSPTLMPGGTQLSVVRVEKDSAQRLWRVSLKGPAMAPLISDIKPVGYHAWIDDNLLALYVLGDRAKGVPSTLQIADIRGGAPIFAARNIGRGLAKIPNSTAVAFIQLDSVAGPSIMRYDAVTKKTTRIAPVLEGAQDFAWTPGGRLLMAKGPEIFEFVVSEWRSIISYTTVGITTITRLSVSPNGEQLAFVVQEKTP